MLTLEESAKIELMTEGMTVSENAKKEIEGDTRRPLTLNDYASTSGISMSLGDGNVWVNVPLPDINPNFVMETTPWALDFYGGIFVVRKGNQEIVANPIRVPDYHNKVNSKGEKYTSFAITHTDRVRISPIEGCAIACKFCDLPYDFKYRKKTVEGLVESVRVALADSTQPAKHVLISGGTPRPLDYDYERDVYRNVVKAFPGIAVDVMMVPMPGLLDPVELRDMGVNGLSINMELANRDIARRITARKPLQDVYLNFIERAVKEFGKEGRVRSLLMVGIEPMEDTLRGVEELAMRGCDPVLSPFRPDPSTPMRNHAPPTVSLLKEVYEGAKEIVSKYEVKLGPRCIPCMHNTLTFPDNSGKYFYS